ncbi:MFS general substrate transporter [Meredithblackwellia eburnea MCA 4105]
MADDKVPPVIQATLQDPLVVGATSAEGIEAVSDRPSQSPPDKTGDEKTSNANEARERLVNEDVDLEEGKKETDGDETGAKGEAPAELATHFKNGLQDQSNYLPAKQIIIVFLGMTMVIFLSFMDQTIVSTALPIISSAFNAGRSSSWVASAYLLTSTAFQPVWGRLSDVFGRKITLIVCVVIFLLGSLACALAQSMQQLIVFRGLQGVGGGGFLTLVLIIVSDIVSLQERGKYQGINEITIAIANGVGPLIGGVLSEKVGWRWCFWINLPIGAVTILLLVFFLPLMGVKGEMRQKLLQIDYVGAVLTIIGAGLIIFPLNWGGTSFAWTSGPVIGCLVAGVTVLGLFMVWEWRVARIPIISPSIFKSGTVNAVLGATLVSGACLLSQVYYLPQYLQIVRGDSAIRAGILMIPLLVLITASVFISGQIVARTGEYRRLIFSGYAIWTVGLGLLSTIDQNTSTARFIGYMVITAVGQGQTLQTSMVAAQAAVPRHEMSVVTASRTFVRSLGGSIALAICAAIINNTLRSNLASKSGFTTTIIDALIDDPTAIWGRSTKPSAELVANLPPAQKAEVIAAYVKGFRIVFYMFTGMLAWNFLVALLFIKRISLKRDDEQALKAKGKAWMEHRKNKGKEHGDADVEKGALSSSPASEHETVVDREEESTKKETLQ